MKILSSILVVALVLPVHAQGQDSNEQILNMITLTADRICTVVTDKGTSTSSEVSGNIDAQLKGLAAKLAGVGVNGTASLNNESFQGPLREDLARYVQDNNKCKLEVFNRLQEKLILQQRSEPDKPNKQFKVIVCTGQYESNCAGPHNIFYTCGYGSVEDLAKKACEKGPPKILWLNVKSGNRCGYGLAEITCDI